jgi:hypothetical protein
MDGGNEGAKVSRSLDIVVFLSGPLWHMSASLKHLSLAKVVTTDICVNQVAR